MADEGVQLVDHVLPEVGYRQWVLTFPFWLRPAVVTERVELINGDREVRVRLKTAWKDGTAHTSDFLLLISSCA